MTGVFIEGKDLVFPSYAGVASLVTTSGCFPGVILTWAYAGNADGDQFIALRGSHVGGRERDLGCVPGAAAAALLDRDGGVAGDGGPVQHRFHRQPRRLRRAPDDQGLRVEGGVPGAVHHPAGERPASCFTICTAGCGWEAAPLPRHSREQNR